MHTDKTTLADLSIFNEEEEQSVFHSLNFARTIGGREWLRHFLSNPFNNTGDILRTQEIIKKIQTVLPGWQNTLITNGTIMVIEKYYETSIAEIPHNAGAAGSLSYTIFNKEDFSFVRYSIKHFIDFFLGLQQLITLLSDGPTPPALQTIIEQITLRLNKNGLQQLLRADKNSELTKSKLLTLGHFLKRRYKEEARELIEIYSKLDAWYSMAMACSKHQFCFPELIEGNEPIIKATELYHTLLPTPVGYNVELNPERHFLFLTGANMGGKSTFIKAVGVAVFLAHTGMGVPAKQMQLTLFDGLLSNINVVDNIMQGESYFFNEVQRIRKTIEKISDGKKWLILIDELFKGTNVQDAMKCSSTVIEGLLKIKNSFFILSTHLYEIGEDLKKYTHIQFKYFETAVVDGQLHFSYQLKDGISNDRLGYLILKREGVVEMLERL
jgi:DNA mismatch repair protein MutS